jgi:hypothetical protein
VGGVERGTGRAATGHNLPAWGGEQATGRTGRSIQPCCYLPASLLFVCWGVFGELPPRAV